MNISSLVTKNTTFYPDRKAIICGDDGREFTWQEFDEIVNKTGNALINMGVNKGDRVAIYLPNSPEFLFTYFAAARIGAVATPFNILYKCGEITYILNNSRAKVLVGASPEIQQNLLNHRDKVSYLERVITVGDPLGGTEHFDNIISEAGEALQTVDCHQDDLVSLLYTSGTTGQPKGAMLTHGNFMANAALNGSSVLHVNDQDRFLTATPFCHIFFVLTVLGPFYAGSGVVTMKRFNPDKTLEVISRYRVTHFAGVPTMYIFMLQQYDRNKHDLKTWRFAQSAGASMPMEHIREIEEIFGVGFCECYGSTETSSTVAYGRLGHGKPGSVGPAANGYQLKVVDEAGNELPAGEVGELLVKGPGIFKGYWEMAAATEEAFDGKWFRTSDLSKTDQDGYFYIVDRKKDMIICGGYNVYPREVEEVIYQHPKVMEVAVIGARDPARGEIPRAFIRLKNGEEMTEQELVDFCKERIASYKVPRSVLFVEELPKSPTGKILKRMLSD